jgi:hypothetical protein
MESNSGACEKFPGATSPFVTRHSKNSTFLQNALDSFFQVNFNSMALVHGGRVELAGYFHFELNGIVF